jgi:hypothetical protein
MPTLSIIASRTLTIGQWVDSTVFSSSILDKITMRISSTAYEGSNPQVRLIIRDGVLRNTLALRPFLNLSNAQ